MGAAGPVPGGLRHNMHHASQEGINKLPYWEGWPEEPAPYLIRGPGWVPVRITRPGGEQDIIRHDLSSDSGGQGASDEQPAQNEADSVAKQGAARLSVE